MIQPNTIIRNWPDDYINKVICADCLSFMRGIPDKSVSIVTDPVWPNTTADLPGKEDPYGLFAKAAVQMVRIARRIVVHLGTDSDPRILAPISHSMPFIRTIDLSYARPHFKGRILYGNDIAYAFGEVPRSVPGKHVLPGRHVNSAQSDLQWGFPCPRRLSHVQFLVGFFTEDDDLILDPFLGSGTTAVAAIRTGRRFIGIEISQDYVNLARKRVAAELAQTKLPLYEVSPCTSS